MSKQDKIAMAAVIGCCWMDMTKCKWYEFGRKSKLKIRMRELKSKILNN